LFVRLVGALKTMILLGLPKSIGVLKADGADDAIEMEQDTTDETPPTVCNSGNDFVCYN